MDSNTLVLVIALVAVALALVVSLIALLNSRKALNKSRSDSIESIAKREVENYMLLKYNQKVKNYVHEEFLRQQSKPAENQSTLVEDATSGSVTLAQEPEPEKAIVEIKIPEPVTYYTGICKDGAFKHVTSVPDNKTIYTIYAEGKDDIDGILNVDQSAYDKIAQTPDYLQNACVYSGNGTHLKVTKTGTVVKENGIWVVKEPIEAEFN